MSSAYSCDCACPGGDTVVQIPGSAGQNGIPGEDGAAGISAFTVTTAAFVIPAIGANETVSVGVSSAFGIGQVVFVSDGVDFGHFRVDSIPGSTSLDLEFLGYVGDAAPGANIAIGATVSPSGTQPALAVPLPTVITDNSTGTASNTIAAGAGVGTITIPLTSLATGLGALAIDLLTGYVLGYRFKILSFDFVATIVGAGAGASQIFNIEIGATNLTGGVLTVTLASTDTIGEVTAGTAVTAANVGTAADAISIEMAAGGTVFTSGSGYFLIRVQNMDQADSIASLSDHVNSLIASLT